MFAIVSNEVLFALVAYLSTRDIIGGVREDVACATPYANHWEAAS